jgi:hypothetical protein
MKHPCSVQVRSCVYRVCNGRFAVCWLHIGNSIQVLHNHKAHRAILRLWYDSEFRIRPSPSPNSNSNPIYPISGMYLTELRTTKTKLKTNQNKKRILERTENYIRESFKENMNLNSQNNHSFALKALHFYNFKIQNTNYAMHTIWKYCNLGASDLFFLFHVVLKSLQTVQIKR